MSVYLGGRRINTPYKRVFLRSVGLGVSCRPHILPLRGSSHIVFPGEHDPRRTEKLVRSKSSLKFHHRAEDATPSDAEDEGSSAAGGFKECQVLLKDIVPAIRQSHAGGEKLPPLNSQQ